MTAMSQVNGAFAAPVTVHAWAHRALPIVTDLLHGGTHYPADAGPNAPFQVLRRAEGLYVDPPYEHVPQQDAKLIAATFQRAYRDPNQLLADIEPTMLDAPSPSEAKPGPKTKRGLGLVWWLLGDVPISARTLPVSNVQQRIDRCYRPNHAALDQAIKSAYRRHGTALHLPVHSMPEDSYARSGLPDKPPTDFALGHLHGRTACEPLMALIERVLREHRQSVAREGPVKGFEIIARSGRPAERRHSLQIEVKRSCPADVEGHAPNQGLPRVQRAIGQVLAALAEHAPLRCPAH
jgi:N-formylglutamate deformylase